MSVKRTLWRRYHGRKAALYNLRSNLQAQNSSTEADLSFPRKVRAATRLVAPGCRSRIVVVASSMRTGSTLLCGMAASLPSVESEYEALNPSAYGWMGLRGAQECADLVRDLSRQAPVMVIKVFASHLEQAGTDWPSFADALPEARWIHLFRHDVAAQYTSLVRAKSSQRWLVQDDATIPAVVPVEVDIDGLARHHQSTVAADRAAHDALSGRPGFRRIRYEDFEADAAAWADDHLAELFGVDHVPVKVPYRRQGTERLEDGLVNPEVLMEAERRGIRWHPGDRW